VIGGEPESIVFLAGAVILFHNMHFGYVFRGI